MTLTVKLNLSSVMLNQRAKYLGQMSFGWKVIAAIQTHSHTGPIALPDGWTVTIWLAFISKQVTTRDALSVS